MGSQKRYDIRVMIDASAFLDDLRLMACRQEDAIMSSGLYTSEGLTFVSAKLQHIIWEIENGYETLLHSSAHRASSQDRVGP